MIKKEKDMIDKQEKMIENFMSSIIFSNEPDVITNILTIIDNPFINRNGIDATSLLFHRFYKHTDLPIALPTFGFFSIISAFSVFNKCSYNIPFDPTSHELGTWVMALAPSGSGKTMAMTQLLNLLPKNSITGEPVVKPNFIKPDGPKAMVQQLADLPDNRGFWFQDEASQMFKQIEQPNSPMSEIRGMLLAIKDHKAVSRVNSKENIVAEGTVMTQFFINTIDSMARSISEESLHDGLLRRYQVAYAENDDRKHTDFALYKLEGLFDDVLIDELCLIFNQNISNNNYTFDNNATILYERMYKVFWEKQYSKFMEGSENFYRTYMIESFKYAIFHHIINRKEGTVINDFSMQYGLKVSMFLLNSLQRFIKYKAGERSLVIQKNKIENIMNFINENENKKGFGFRIVQRKFNMKKDELVNLLKSIKLNDPTFKTKLFDKL
jgi:hypothetical protein